MLTRCQILRESRLLSSLTLLQKHRFVKVPPLRLWSVSLLHSKATDGIEQKVGGLQYGRVELTGTRTQQPNSEAPIKRGSNFRPAADALFANAAESSFNNKFDGLISLCKRSV